MSRVCVRVVSTRVRPGPRIPSDTRWCVSDESVSSITRLYTRFDSFSEGSVAHGSHVYSCKVTPLERRDAAVLHHE